MVSTCRCSSDSFSRLTPRPSSVALWLFVYSEGSRLRMKNLWLYVACNLAVGVSLALPLFLFFRERRLKPAAADR